MTFKFIFISRSQNLVKFREWQGLLLRSYLFLQVLVFVTQTCLVDVLHMLADWALSQLFLDLVVSGLQVIKLGPVHVDLWAYRLQLIDALIIHQLFLVLGKLLEVELNVIHQVLVALYLKQDLLQFYAHLLDFVYLNQPIHCEFSSWWIAIFFLKCRFIIILEIYRNFTRLRWVISYQSTYQSVHVFFVPINSILLNLAHCSIFTGCIWESLLRQVRHILETLDKELALEKLSHLVLIFLGTDLRIRCV